jgi:amino-acid N-acetyltransferase
MEIRRATPEDLDRTNLLLGEASLPPLPRYFPLSDVLVAMEGSAVVGVIALEVLGLLGLVRCAAVAPGHARQAVGSSLLQALVCRASELSLRELFTLTGDDEGFFANAGFSSIPRASVPSEIRSTTQFREQCPDTASVMRFQLATRNV